MDRQGSGSYAIVGSGLASSNYAITPVEAAGNANAYRIDPASLTITANNADHSFDAKAFRGGNGATVTGLVNGDTLASLTSSLPYGGSAQGAVIAGIDQITASGLTSGNGLMTYLAGALLITPLNLQIPPSFYNQVPATLLP